MPMRNLNPDRSERAHGVVIEWTKPIGRFLLLKVVNEFVDEVAAPPENVLLMRNLDPDRSERAHGVVNEWTKPIERDLLLKVRKEFMDEMAALPGS
jgi:hypothetical protein